MGQMLTWGVLPGVRSCYDEGKRTAETLAMDYHRGAGVEVSIYFTGWILDTEMLTGWWSTLKIRLIIFSLPIRFFLQVRIARIFNTYGPRMCIDDGRVVSNFVAQVIRSSRFFCFLDIMNFLVGTRVEIVIINWGLLQALRKEPMTVYGDGKQTRSFQFVSDLVSRPVRLLSLDLLAFYVLNCAINVI